MAELEALDFSREVEVSSDGHTTRKAKKKKLDRDESASSRSTDSAIMLKLPAGCRVIIYRVQRARARQII